MTGMILQPELHHANKNNENDTGLVHKPDKTNYSDSKITQPEDLTLTCLKRNIIMIMRVCPASKTP